MFEEKKRNKGFTTSGFFPKYLIIKKNYAFHQDMYCFVNFKLDKCIYLYCNHNDLRKIIKM